MIAPARVVLGKHVLQRPFLEQAAPAERRQRRPGFALEQAREPFRERRDETLLAAVDDLMRLKCNPFFPYLEERLREWVAR